MKASNLFIYEKTEVDLKKGVRSREPDDGTRLEEEDLIKMNHDTAILGLSDLDEDDDSLNTQQQKNLTTFENTTPGDH